MRCEYCAKEHDGSFASGRFCCKECSRGYSTRSKRKEINKKVSAKLNKKIPILKQCEQCGKEHDSLYGSGRFCSLSCKQSFVIQSAWNKGLSRKTFANKGTQEKAYEIRTRRIQEMYSNMPFIELPREEKKRRILKEQEGSCVCGLYEWQGQKLILELHHVDGNNKNDLRENLQLLCPNCHSLTETWRRAKKYL